VRVAFALAAVVPVRVVASVAAVVLVARVASVRVVAVLVVALRVPLAFGVMSAVLCFLAEPSIVTMAVSMTMAAAGTCPLVRRRLTMAPRGRFVVVAPRVARGRSRIVSHQAARSRARGWPEHVDDERRGDDDRQGDAHESFQPCHVFASPFVRCVAWRLMARRRIGISRDRGAVTRPILSCARIPSARSRREDRPF